MLHAASIPNVEVVWQGSVFEIIDKSPPASVAAQAVADGRRGKVTGFSAASRRRLVDMFARIDGTGHSPKFLTFTFQHNVTLSEGYACLRRFLERLKRKYPMTSGVWRREYTEAGRLHYHMIIYDMPYFPQKSLQRVWTECTREGLSIVHITAMKGNSHVQRYISKYLAKVHDDDNVSSSLEHASYLHGQDETGRWWGYFNKANLPFAERHVFDITGRSHIRYLCWWIEKESRGRCGTTWITRKLYSDDARQAFWWARDIEKPLVKPFRRSHRQEIEYIDGQLTVKEPLLPATQYGRSPESVGESVLAGLWVRGQTRSAVLMASVCSVRRTLVSTEK